MKRIIILVFVLLMAPVTVRAEEIQNFETEIIVHRDGTIDVSEGIDYDFGTLQRHGIFRYIPYKKTNQDGKNLVLKITKHDVTDKLGNKIKFTTSKSSGNVSFKIGDPEKTITGLKDYIISYNVAGALTYFKDFDEIYWNVSGNEWEVPINSVTAKIILPEEVEEIVNTSCYTGAVGSNNSDCEITHKENYIEIKTTKPLYANEGLTVAVSFPKGYVEVLEPGVDRSPLIWNFLIALYALLTIFVGIIYPIKIIKKILEDNKNVKKYGKEVAAWFSSPKTIDQRNLTPLETKILLSKGFDNRAVTATIIDFAQRGYLKIVEYKNKKFELHKIKEPGTEFRDFEKSLFNALFSRSREGIIKLDDLRKDYTFTANMQKFNKLAIESVYKEGFFEKDLSKEETKHVLIGVLSLFFGFILTFIVSVFFGKKSVKKTPLGIEKYSVAKSLKNFLESQDEQFNFMAENQMFFEKLLPFASALGIEKVWSKRFKDLDIQQPDWYEGNFNSGVMTFAVLNNSFSSNMGMSNTTSSSGFSSGSSGGGFSGGGGGGGGGGSW